MALVARASVFAADVTPIHRLLQMLEWMEDKGLEEKRIEEDDFMKFRLLCGEAREEPTWPLPEWSVTIARLEADIHEAELNLADLEAESALLASEMRSNAAFPKRSARYGEAFARYAIEQSGQLLSNRQVLEMKAIYIQQLTDDLKRAKEALARMKAMQAIRAEDAAKAKADFQSALSSNKTRLGHAAWRLLAEGKKVHMDPDIDCHAKTEEYETNQIVRVAELDAIRKTVEHIASSAVMGAGEKHLLQLQNGTPALSCDTKHPELATNERTRDMSRSWAIAQSNAEGGTTSIALSATEIAELSWAIAQHQMAVQDASELRAGARAMNAIIVADAKGAQAAVEAAIKVLIGFYSDSTGAALPQRMGGADLSAQGMGSAPREPYMGMTAAGGEILGMCRGFLSNLAWLQEEAETTEDQAEMVHTSFMKDSLGDITAKTRTMKHLELQATTTTMKHLQMRAKKKLEPIQTKLDADLAYFEMLLRAEQKLDAALLEAFKLLDGDAFPM